MSNFVMPKTSGYGFQVDKAAPTFPWHDIIGDVRPKTTGTPGAGAIRITVFYRQFVAPTS